MHARARIVILVMIAAFAASADAASPAFSERALEAGLDHFSGIFFDTQAGGFPRAGPSVISTATAGRTCS